MKFLVIADTHWGGKNLTGFQMQPRYPEQLEELLAALDRLVRREQVSFVLHAGDLTDDGTSEEIQEAVRHLSRHLSVPVRLVLGNHDCRCENCEELWLRNAPGLFPEKTLDSTFFLDGIRFDLLNLYWGQNSRRWIQEQGQFIRLSEEQLTRLRTGDQSSPRIIAMHSQIRAAEQEKTGLDYILLEPENNFSQVGDDIISEFHPALILSGHNHLTQSDLINGTWAISASSFCESPFECRLVDIHDGTLFVHTVSLGSEMSFEYKYRPENFYVQGEAEEREIVKQL